MKRALLILVVGLYVSIVIAFTTMIMLQVRQLPAPWWWLLAVPILLGVATLIAAFLYLFYEV